MVVPPIARVPLAALLLLVSLAAQQRIRLHDGWSMAVKETTRDRPPDDWGEATVPATFESQLGPDFDGTVWYQRHLDLAPARQPSTLARLEFEGAATAAEVLLNHTPIGNHLGAWTAWRVDLPPALIRGDGTDLLEVRLDELVGHDTQGFLPIIQPHFGGLWRPVHLCFDRAPRIDQHRLMVFGDASTTPAHVACEVPILAGPPTQTADALSVRIEVFDGATVIARDDRAVTAGTTTLNLEVPNARPWSPHRPQLYRVRIELRDATTDHILDTTETRTGFRDLHSAGRRILCNNTPLHIRGVLHWGYSPPHFAPPDDPAWWRRQLEDFRSLGFNLIKVCLWVPPRCFYEICDEIGLLVWQEYPTWHPRLTADRLPALRTEFDEFHYHDRGHVSVAFRSLTCETGHSAELAVIQALYDRCKELIPQTLVVDDSAWIEWHRIHDFYDDHPYGNNSWWPGKLSQIDAWVDAREAKPILFGECIAADTWFDFAEWDARGLADDAWSAPWGLGPQREFAAAVATSFGTELRDNLLAGSRAFALQMRKYQIERIRRSLPDAGYVVSVARDFTKARMGLYDDFDRLKWSAAEWSWHGDSMLCLATEGDGRSFVAGPIELPLQVVHYGSADWVGRVELRVPALGFHATSDPLTLAKGSVSSPVIFQVDASSITAPTPLRIEATFQPERGGVLRNEWNVWVVPPPRGVIDDDVLVVDRLDRPTFDHLLAGGRVLLQAGERAGSLRTRSLWFLRGAPFAPPHAINQRAPSQLLEDLHSFDLETGRVLDGEALFDQVDPVLAFWDTHDIHHVERWLTAFTTRVGTGRLAATTLRDDTPAGRWVLEALAETLRSDTPPQRALAPTTITRLRDELAAEVLDLRDWQLATDPKDLGLAAGWGAKLPDDLPWRPIRAGAHWETQGLDHYDGVAWHRIGFDVPARWQGSTVTAVFDGVDDSYHLFVNGVLAGRFGDPATGATVWLERTTTDISKYLRYDARNEIVLRVVDHTGAGGLHRPAFVTTGPADRNPALIH